MIQCDASEKSLGAALLQDGKHVAFASRDTYIKTRYAQIEKELLAIVFSVEKFDKFTFGRTAHVQSDHKLLEKILKKPLHHAPKLLQSMMLRLKRYDILYPGLVASSCIWSTHCLVHLYLVINLAHRVI